MQLFEIKNELKTISPQEVANKMTPEDKKSFYKSVSISRSYGLPYYDEKINALYDIIANDIGGATC